MNGVDGDGDDDGGDDDLDVVDVKVGVSLARRRDNLRLCLDPPAYRSSFNPNTILTPGYL